MPEARDTRSSRWLSVIVVDKHAFGCDREAIRLALEEENIESRPVWKPMHLQPAFRAARYVGGTISQRLFEQGLCLPSGSQMSDADVTRVAEIVSNCSA
jgi:dTDP-4-amino-4,6-dideoxygalactose transaminase